MAKKAVSLTAGCCMSSARPSVPDNPRTHHLPSGMMERYLPLNLLAMVISCHNVHPRLEYTWWAAAGGWWLTWGQDTQPMRTWPPESLADSSEREQLSTRDTPGSGHPSLLLGIGGTPTRCPGSKGRHTRILPGLVRLISKHDP